VAPVAIAAPGGPATVVVVDHRAPGAPGTVVDRVEDAVRARPELRLVASPRDDAFLEMGRANAAYARLDCKEASAAAERAALALLAIDDVAAFRPEIVHLISMMLLCAHQASDAAGARTAVARLRALGLSDPPA